MAYANVAAGASILSSTTNDLIGAGLNSIVAQGNRSTASGTTSGTTELGVLRLDNLVLKSGYAYEFFVGGIRTTFSVATTADKFKLALRYSGAGAATTSSTEIGRAEEFGTLSGANWPNVSGWVLPVADTTTASVIFTMLRTAGTGTLVTLADTGGLWLTVKNHGLAVADTGVDV